MSDAEFFTETQTADARVNYAARAKERVWVVFANNGEDSARKAEEWILGIYRERAQAEEVLRAYEAAAGRAGTPGFSYSPAEDEGYEDCYHWYQCRIEEHEVS